MQTDSLFTKRRPRSWSAYFTQAAQRDRLPTLLAALALALVFGLSAAPAAYAFPAETEAHINGSDCLLVDAIIAANTDMSAGDCNPGNPGADTIELLDNVTLFTAIGTAGLPEVNSAITINGNGFTIAGIDDVFGIIRVVSGGDLTLNDTTITAGFGVFGGIYNAGTLTLNNSTVTGNGTLAGQTGGIMNYGVTTLNHSTVSDNIDGGIYNAGPLTLNNSTVSGNTGPGIINGNMLTLSNSTVSGNTGYFGGGGIDNAGTLTVSDSTISGNSAFNSGGGIYNSGALTLERSLIAGNTAINGQEIFSAGCLSAASANTPDCLASASAVNAADSNLFGHNGLTNAQAFSGFTPDVDDITATSDGTTPTALSAILGPLAVDSGALIHALVTSSPAIDAATSGPATDQRGVSRPQGCGFDIGAYELEQPTCPTGNEAPVVTANNASVTVDEGQTATNTGAVSDPDGDTVTLSASVGTVVNNGDGAWSWSFTTTDGPPDSQAVTITADDGNGGTAQTTFNLTVNNVAPSVGAISASVDPQPVGTAVNASASFSDPGTGDIHTATWDWGDGNTSAGTVGSGTVGPDSHAYTTPGVYTVQLTVTDDDGGVGQSIYQYVVVYDPAGGFVTGGGWITSPAGAYPADPSLTGKANFGFNSKYKNGASVPTGNTQFQFQVANLNFKSTSYEWLVVAGSHAKYKGVGAINGNGNYGFMLTATDGQVNGGGGVDKFRIKIWDKNNGDAVVYDNQMGQGDDSNAGTALGGGSIVIHKGGANGASVDDDANAQPNRIFLPVVTR
jgi:hypothetical protein